MRYFKTFVVHFLILPAFLIISCSQDGSSPTSPKVKGYSIIGNVKDKNEEGLSGVPVQITGTGFSAADTTNAGGAFVFEKIPSGSYNIKAVKENRVFKPASLDITVKDSDIDTLNFTVADNYVHGKVIDIITNKGMADITICIDDEETHTLTKTDSSGKFEFFDLPENDSEINVVSNSYSYGSAAPYIYYIKTEELSNSEIVVPTFYMSSEILKITTATYTDYDSTLYLEWTPSQSNFLKWYNVRRTDKLPFGTSGFVGDFYQTNSITIKITPKYRAYIIKIIHFAVSAGYIISRDPYIWLESPISEPVSVQVAK